MKNSGDSFFDWIIIYNNQNFESFFDEAMLFSIIDVKNKNLDLVLVQKLWYYINLTLNIFMLCHAYLKLLKWEEVCPSVPTLVEDIQSRCGHFDVSDVLYRWILAIKASIKKWLPLHQALQDYMNRPPEETRMWDTPVYSVNTDSSPTHPEDHRRLILFADIAPLCCQLVT